MIFAISSDLSWFGRSKYDGGKAERKIFEEKGFCAVYFAGNDHALRLGWTGRDPRKIGEPARIIAWCANDHFAKRIVKALSQILASRLISGRYDVPLDLAEQAVCIAAKKAGIEITNHDTMMQHVKAMMQQKIDRVIRESERRDSDIANF